MNDFPEPDMKPEDVDKLIKAYGRPIDPAHKSRLMDKLKNQKKAFEKAQNAEHPKKSLQDKDNGLSR